MTEIVKLIKKHYFLVLVFFQPKVDISHLNIYFLLCFNKNVNLKNVSKIKRNEKSSESGQKNPNIALTKHSKQ